MITSSKRKLTLLILMSIMFTLAFSDYKLPGGPLTGCTPGTTNCFQLWTSFAVSSATFGTILPENQVLDCDRYKENGQCFCIADQSFGPIEIATTDMMKFGCVPINQRKINGICNPLTPKQYSCECTHTDYKYTVEMMTGDPNNEKNILQGCSKYEIPDCTKWKIRIPTAPLKLLVDDNDDDGWTLECGECATGKAAFTGTLEYETDITGKGCPVDGTYHLESCPAMRLNTGNYECVCGTKHRAQFKISVTQKISQACIIKTDATQGYDENCKLYTYSSTFANIECHTCNSGFSAIQFLTRSGQVLKCTSGKLPGYCAKYFTTQAGTNFATTSPDCLACVKGYNMIYSSTATGTTGTCVPSVEKCAFLSAGGCSACVQGYQLINKNCFQLPPNCQKMDDKGACTQCKSAFSTDSDGKCVQSKINTCPAGQVPSNGVCVQVQVTITDCVRYTIESKCDQCVEGKIPSDDGLSCIVKANTAEPGAKPCPPNTTSVIYRRNRLGGCVAVDANCIDSREDGFCVSCKNGDYAHSDGRCYKVMRDEAN